MSAVRVVATGVLAVWLGLTGEAPAADGLWELLRGGGQVVVMRHASTVAGLGDPPGFRREDCATQRNLSEAGRQEARRIGAAFRAREAPVGRVLSSRWCRCLETARLAFGSAEAWGEGLDSLYEEPGQRASRTAAVRRLAAARPEGGNLVLVTHAANIQALIGAHPAPGEMVVLTPLGGDFRVAGRLVPSALD